jgi:hypothetical protein
LWSIIWINTHSVYIHVACDEQTTSQLVTH